MDRQQLRPAFDDPARRVGLHRRRDDRLVGQGQRRGRARHARERRGAGARPERPQHGQYGFGLEQPGRQHARGDQGRPPEP